MVNSLSFTRLATIMAQTDDTILQRVPLWLIGVVILFVIIFAVVWTMQEEEEVGVAETPTPEPEAMVKTAVIEPKPLINDSRSSSGIEIEPDDPSKASTVKPESVRQTAVIQPQPIIEPKPEPDDLKKIEGIGPKISGLLQEKGILTFAQLANTQVETLRQFMLDAKLRIARPDTWPEQAALAAAGKWEELDTLQDNLKGGRRVS